MKELILYIHGKGGCAGESEHYKPLFPECEVIGLDYQNSTPWESGEEIREAVTKLRAEYDSVTLIGNSIGAFFGMNAGIDEMIHRAYFISPVVDMEKLILNSDLLLFSFPLYCYGMPASLKALMDRTLPLSNMAMQKVGDRCEHVGQADF